MGRSSTKLVYNMPIYEGWITIKESVVLWRFPAPNIKEAKMRLQEEIDRMLEDNVKVGVMQVKKP